MSKCSTTVLTVILTSALVAPALAAKSLGLVAGGRTLAGPGSVVLAVNTTATVFSNGDQNACATVANVGSSAVRLTAIGSTTSSIDVPAGASGALCKPVLDQVDLSCIGVAACTAQWRVDDN
jgi:hypothetical protein